MGQNPKLYIKVTLIPFGDPDETAKALLASDTLNWDMRFDLDDVEDYYRGHLKKEGETYRYIDLYYFKEEYADTDEPYYLRGDPGTFVLLDEFVNDWRTATFEHVVEVKNKLQALAMRIAKAHGLRVDLTEVGTGYG